MAQSGFTAVKEAPRILWSLWRVGGLLMFVSAVLWALYMPCALSGHPLNVANLLYVLVIGSYSVALLYALLNKKPTCWLLAFIANLFYLGVLILPFAAVHHAGHWQLLTLAVLALICLISACWLAAHIHKRYWTGLPAIMLGLFFCSLQFSLLPATQPHTLSTRLEAGGERSVLFSNNKQSDEQTGEAVVLGQDGWIQVQDRQYTVAIQPLLQFRDHNRHRFWSIWGPRDSRDFSPLQCTALMHNLDAARALFTDDLCRHFVEYQRAGSLHDIHAVSVLVDDIYSHLNYCLLININGHQHLELGFSSIKEGRLSLRPGEAQCFATLDESQQLHLYQCTEKEKGPFQDRGSGHWNGESEWLILYDNGEPFIRINVKDWLSQSSLRASPTAGYGVTENAMECLLSGHHPGSTVQLWFSFAATSIGRGFQTVGHKAGTYRMNLQVEFLNRDL